MGFTYYMITNKIIDNEIIIRCAGDDGTCWGEKRLLKDYLK